MNIGEQTQNHSAFIVFQVKPVRKAALNNDVLAYDTIGFIVQRASLPKLALTHYPRIKTPYGLAPDIHIVETGNGLCNIRLWSTGETLAENISISRAKNYLNQHYINLFRKNEKWWNFCHNNYLAAEDHAINLWAETKKISHEQARKQFIQLNNILKAPTKTEAENPYLQHQQLAAGFENMFTMEPGETFKESLAKATKIAPNGMTMKQIVAITHTIRRNSILSQT
jgi:hypothetical protein